MTPKIFTGIMGFSAFICTISIMYMLMKPAKNECEIIPGLVETCNRE